MEIHLASGNAHKVAEFQALAAKATLPWRVVSARESGGMPPVVEDTGTFAGNAEKKARALQAKRGGGWVLADDSGVCVDALGGAPGVESAYFAGPQGDSAANLAKLVAVMRSVPEGQRGASFFCLLYLLAPSGNGYIFTGTCPGTLLHEPRGGDGFGYDPLLVPLGYEASFAELGNEIKNRLSHRAQAFAALVAAWATLPEPKN